MGFHLRRTTCERAVRSISLRLDGELSELEEAALDRHLTQCPCCRAVAEQTTGFTQLLRGAPLVELGQRIEVVSPGWVRARRVRRTAAALALAGGLIVASVAAVLSGTGISGPSHASSALAFRNLEEQQQFARSELVRLEPYAQFVVDTPPPKFAGRGLI